MALTLSRIRLFCCFCIFTTAGVACLYYLQRQQDESNAGNRVIKYDRKSEDRCNYSIVMKPGGTFPLVALASTPGSGNTWVRYLIETTTGIYTGSVFNDTELYDNGLGGELEQWQSGRVIVVKTHLYNQEHARKYDGAIVIIRDPYKAIIAEYNRRFGGGHTGYAPKEEFKTARWPYYAKNESRWWADVPKAYLLNTKKVLVIYYEDLLTHLSENLKKIVDFLGVPLDQHKLLCTLKNPQGKFKRLPDKGRQLDFDPYTKELRKYINACMEEVSVVLRLKNQTLLPSQYHINSDSDE